MMNRLRHLWAVAALLLVGCSSLPKEAPHADDPAAREQIELLLDDIFDAAERKDFERLDEYHLYGPKFTKFGAEQPGRQDAATTRRTERAGLGAASGLSMQAEDLKIDLFGQVGIVTFILKYSSETGSGRVEKVARATMVFVQEDAGWKIAHEHFSPCTPSP